MSTSDLVPKLWRLGVKSRDTSFSNIMIVKINHALEEILLEQNHNSPLDRNQPYGKGMEDAPFHHR